MANKLEEIRNLGQGFWLDEIRREYLLSGKLGRLIADDGLTGLTTNPTIFQKAITGSGIYDDEIRTLAEKGLSAEDIFNHLSRFDIQQAADLFKGVYGESDGADGYVSAEVRPSIAYQAEATVNEALRLREWIGRENIFIKVPGTPEGNEAVRRLTSLGVKVNITLLFGVDQYRESASAYIAGLRDRAGAGEAIGDLVSVASVFVSRVDTAVDAWLDSLLGEATTAEKRAEVESLRGRAAVANGKIVYRTFKELLSSAESKELFDQGAPVQRIVWGSTGTKNPAYSDVKYVDDLIGPHTVNTMPLATLDAFRDHGAMKNTVEQNVEEAERVLARLNDFGFDLDEAHEKLQKDGVVAFDESYQALITSIEEKRSLFSKAKL